MELILIVDWNLTFLNLIIYQNTMLMIHLFTQFLMKVEFVKLLRKLRLWDSFARWAVIHTKKFFNKFVQVIKSIRLKLPSTIIVKLLVEPDSTLIIVFVLQEEMLQPYTMTSTIKFWILMHFYYKIWVQNIKDIVLI